MTVMAHPSQEVGKFLGELWLIYAKLARSEIMLFSQIKKEIQLL